MEAKRDKKTARRNEKSLEKEEEKDRIRERSREKDKEKIGEILKNFQESKEENVSKGFIQVQVIESNSSIIDKYENKNKSFLINLNNNEVSEKYSNIMASNREKTNKKEAIELGKRLYEILSNISSKKVSIVQKPKVFYNKKLNDNEFLKTVEVAIEYAIAKKNTRTNKKNRRCIRKKKNLYFRFIYKKPNNKRYNRKCNFISFNK